MWKAKRLTIIILIVILSCTGLAIYAVGTDVFMSAKDADTFIEEQLAKKREYYGITEEFLNDQRMLDFSEAAYERATPEQKKELEVIFSEDPFDVGIVTHQPRRVLIALNELPKDAPRLTLIGAEAACSELNNTRKADYNIDEWEMNAVNALNKIAGAPDWEGGSGIYRWVYYLNDDYTEAIYVMLGQMAYVQYDEKGNERQSFILNQEIESIQTSPNLSEDKRNETTAAEKTETTEPPK